MAFVLPVILVFFALDANAQIRAVRSASIAQNIIVPQSRSFSVGRSNAIEITQVEVGVVILGQAAVTTMDVSLKNNNNRLEEAELIVPIPENAIIKGFTFSGNSDEPTAEILLKDQAKATYQSIVAKVRDPALMEFAGSNLIRTSVFPVPARGNQKVRVTYEHLLEADEDRVDYVLPRTESVDYQVPWKISVKIKAKRPVSTVYSPSHEIETVRKAKNVVSARITEAAAKEPGSFRLSYLLQKGGVTASIYTYPDSESNGGYFLMLAGLPAKLKDSKEGQAIKREVTLVIDRSGSMKGEKIAQVRKAVYQIIDGLEEGESFRLITYDESVSVFSRQPVYKNAKSLQQVKTFLDNTRALGGTNIHAALLEALRQKPDPGSIRKYPPLDSESGYV